MGLYSPSKSTIWSNCPGSVGYVEKHKLKSEDTTNTIAGTRAHHLLHESLEGRLDLKSITMIGMSFTDKHGKWKPDQEMLDAVIMALDYIDKVVGSANVVSIVSEQRVDSGGYLTIEENTKLPIGVMVGNCDVYIHAKHYLEVIEFKYGMSEVDIENNTPLALYAGGAMLKINTLKANGVQEYGDYYPNGIITTIIQPRIKVLGQEPIKHKTLSIEHLDSEYKRIHEAIIASQSLASSLNAGSWCKYCPAIGHCPSNAEQSLSVLDYDPTNIVDQSMQYKDVTILTDKQLVDMFLASKQIKQMLVACEVELTSRTNHKSVEGVKLVQGNGSKSWVDDTDVGAVMDELLIPNHVRYISKPLSPAQALKLSWTTNDGVTHKLTKDQKDRLLEAITTNKGKPMLVFENDSRTAIKTDVSERFKALPTASEMPGWDL